MKDYADPILRLKIGEKHLHNLLLSSKLNEVENIANDMIVSLIEIKQWAQENQNVNNEQV